MRSLVAHDQCHRARVILNYIIIRRVQLDLLVDDLSHKLNHMGPKQDDVEEELSIFAEIFFGWPSVPARGVPLAHVERQVDRVLTEICGELCPTRTGEAFAKLLETQQVEYDLD
jgi:hypothetical protein